MFFFVVSWSMDLRDTWNILLKDLLEFEKKNYDKMAVPQPRIRIYFKDLNL